MAYNNGGIKCLAILISMQLFISVWSAAVPLSTVPKSAHSQLLMDVVRLISSSTVTKAAARDSGDKTELRCQLKEVSTCFNDALGKFYKSLLNDDLIDAKLSICSLADDLSTCTNALQQPECRLHEILTFDAITKGSRYFCTLQGYNNYLGLKPCLTRVHVVKELKECRHKLTLPAADMDSCKLFDAYVNCAVDATKTSCAADVEDILKESLTALLLPYREAICPSSRSVAPSGNENPVTPRKSLASRSRREAEDFGSFFGGGSFDGLAGGYSLADLFGGEMPALTDFTMPGSLSQEAEATQESAAPGNSWGQMGGEQSLFSNPDFPWDLLQRLSQGTGQGAGSSEEISTMATDVVTQEQNSEEVTMGPPEHTTPEISSEEVNTAAPDTTPQADSSEEVSTNSPDTTLQADSSEEVSTTSPETTPQADSSEEVSTTSPETTPQADSSEEVSTTSPETTPQADSSEEVSTTSPDTTPQADSSEEVSTTSPETTPQADSSEEVSTTSPDTTPQADSSEEVSTTSPDTTPQADSSEEASTTSPDTTPQADSSEEASTTSPDTTPQADSSEEVSTASQDTTPTTDANSEGVSSSQPETTTTTPPTTPEPEIVTPEPEIEASTTPATTTKSPHIAPFHCYECHSGTAGYWLNPMCPPNGKINGWAALPVDCEGPCVSVVTKYPKGEVYRACSTNYYFAFKVPYDGCIRHNQELYCFCSGDLCNTRDMVADQQAFILTGLITKY